jgi:hypothetical protein
MDSSAYQSYNQTAGTAQGQKFPPLPPNSGAAQNDPVPIVEAYPTVGVAGRLPQQDSYTAPTQPPRPPPISDLSPNPKSQHLQQMSGLEAGAVPHSEPNQYPPPPPQIRTNADDVTHDKPVFQPPRPQYEQPTYAQAWHQDTYEPLPQLPRPQLETGSLGAKSQDAQSAYAQSAYALGAYVPPLPPRRHSQNFGADDLSNPIHYARDPHKLIAYLVPFPKPRIQGIDPATIPDRFLIYTPPPPPLAKPAEGEKEAKLHKVQRKWQEEVRAAKTSTAKTASWQGVKSKATRGIGKAMQYTTPSNLDFLGRATGGSKSDSEADGVHEGETTHKTVGVEELVLVHPPMGMNPDEMRAEFVNTMLRTKTKAQRDAIISTGLLPVAYGIDILATLVWPFGGLGEIDTVWAYASIRGAKTARSITKRLSSTSATGDHENDKLHLRFEPSQRIAILRQYLAADCHKTDPKLFPEYASAPTETEVLEAIGWNPHQNGGEEKNWEDEQWQRTEVKEDVRVVMHKGAREWDKWCKLYAKDPEKAMKK